MNHLKISLVPGKLAPKYEEVGIELFCQEVVITEQGTEGGLPMVDFKMVGPDGVYLMVLTGRIVNAISAAVKGVNLRNHGAPEP